jgi:hypothetical protein
VQSQLVRLGLKLPCFPTAYHASDLIHPFLIHGLSILRSCLRSNAVVHAIADARAFVPFGIVAFCRTKAPMATPGFQFNQSRH